MSDTPILATARLKDLEAYKTFWRSKNYNWANDLRSELLPLLYDKSSEAHQKLNSYLYQGFHSYIYKESEEEKNERFHRTAEEMLTELSQSEAYSKKYNQPFQVSFLCEHGALIFLGNRSNSFFILDHQQFLELQYLPSYEDRSLNELRAIMNGSAAPTTVPATANGTLSVKGLRHDLSSHKSKIKQLEEELKDTKEGKTEQLRELQKKVDEAMAELNAKKELLMAELDAKKRALEEQVEQMNDQIFLLESQIYAIRCYLGEVVNFAQIRTGRNAPDTEPVILHQKLRFLDEELGRLTSLYGLDFSEIHMFEEYLAVSPTALDVFAPNERCVTIVRLTRNNKCFGRHEKYNNMLQAYEVYHGRTVGIVIRNGENLYVGWTDEEKVKVTEDLILTLSPGEMSPGESGEESEWNRERRIKSEKAQMRAIINEVVSRVFIFNILQGIVDNSDLLPLPPKVRISAESEYVKFSLADKWLTDNRFGSFTDIIAKCNSHVSQGDMILTVMGLTPNRDQKYREWNNDRGRGEKNRTHDCSVDSCEIYPINLIEYDDPVSMVRYRYRVNPDIFTKRNNPDAQAYWQESTIQKDRLKYLCSEHEVIEEYDFREAHYFVSVLKRYSYSGTARSNFEVYKDEFINLHYMNSVWLAYAITNRSLGDWRIGGQQVDYAYAIEYLNKAMEHIRKREEEEKRVLDSIDPDFCSRTPEWPLALSEWKLAHKVRTFSKHNASRFIHSLPKN